MDYQPKFAIGDLVHYVGDPQGLNGTVEAVHLTRDGFRYDITSQDVDVQARVLLNGMKPNLTEAELELPVEPTAEASVETPAAPETPEEAHATE